MPNDEQTELLTLTARAKTGDERAMDALLGLLQPKLRAFFLSRIGGRPDVDDLIQNTLLRVHKGLADLKDDSRLRGFTMKAALFELQDFYRGRYTPKETLFESGHLPDFGGHDATASHRIDAEKALSLLSDKARRIIELREYGYKYEEIADMVDSTEAAVKMQVKRAFDRMKDLLVAFVIGLMLQSPAFWDPS